MLSTAQRIESVEYAEIVQSVDIEEFGGCRTSVGEIDRVADRENFFFRVIVAPLVFPDSSQDANSYAPSDSHLN